MKCDDGEARTGEFGGKVKIVEAPQLCIHV